MLPDSQRSEFRLKHRLACPEEEPRDVSRDFVTVYNHKDLDYTITGLLPYSLYEVSCAVHVLSLPDLFLNMPF